MGIFLFIINQFLNCTFATNLPYFIHNQVLIRLINVIMNLKVFYVSFINLLVALAVTAANASPSNPENLLAQSSIEYKKSNFHKSDYLIAKYLGSENANMIDAINTVYDRKTKQTPTSFIDGEYSNEFL